MEILKINNRNIHGLCRLLLLCSLLTTMSCEKQADVKLPDTEPKPVLVCFISPEDSLIRLQLTNSVPLYSTSTKSYPYEIKDAEIIISDGSMSIQVPWYKDTVGYLLNTSLFKVIPGATYFLSVKIPDGRVLRAETTVPKEDFPKVDFTYDKQLLDSNEFGISYELNYTLKWKDIIGVKNYYRGLIYNLYSDSLLSVDTTAQLMSELFETDDSRDGADMRLNGKGYLSYSSGSSVPLMGGSFIGYLMSANKDYYLYHKDLSENMGDNPFSEAKINFTNIEGGIGCFGAYRLSKKRF